jgi:hypothetical protein
LPTLFAIFVNDLVQEINDLHLGIKMNETSSISMLLYADDIVLISNNSENLQIMLNTMHNWCKRWRVLINCEKSKVMRFRKGRTKQCDHIFKIGDNSLETVDRYKYLGVILHDKQNINVTLHITVKLYQRVLVVFLVEYIISKTVDLKHFRNYTIPA